jgi:hypothetical protein
MSDQAYESALRGAVLRAIGSCAGDMAAGDLNESDAKQVALATAEDYMTYCYNPEMFPPYRGRCIELIDFWVPRLAYLLMDDCHLEDWKCARPLL